MRVWDGAWLAHAVTINTSAQIRTDGEYVVFVESCYGPVTIVSAADMRAVGDGSLIALEGAQLKSPARAERRDLELSHAILCPMVRSTSSPYKRYYNIFYKGLGLAHWVYDRESFAVSVGFNRGTLQYSRGRWAKLKPGGYPGAFFGRETAGGRELWSVDSGVVNVVPWDKLLGRKSRGARRSERISDASVTDFCVIDDVALAIDDDGSVFRRTTPVTNAEGTWQLDTTLKPVESLVAITGRSLDDIWVAGHESVWHYDGAAWKRVRLPSRLRLNDIACGSKYVYVCGGETLVRIGSGRQVTRFDSGGC
ncbi:MAG: hypothetical protein H0W87_05060, partial [Actinobacteria bacterium]|nr:hypothetical protein [Actinomycetota bacterium]